MVEHRSPPADRNPRSSNTVDPVGATTDSTVGSEHSCDKRREATQSSAALAEDDDGRGLYAPLSRWEARHRRQHLVEGVYLAGLLAASLAALSLIGLEVCGDFLSAEEMPVARRFAFLGFGGLLGGTVYGAKWLYHSVAKGLWHEDRRIWRYLSPLISLGATVGIWSLMDAGVFPSLADDSAGSIGTPYVKVLGIGFVIGYLSDRFLAKMKDLTNVLFGQTEQHFSKSDRRSDRS